MNDKLVIKVVAEGSIGRISIIGEINEWNRNNADNFRQKCQELKDSGISRALVYLMTVGGDCFQANEITNILDECFPDSYDGEGGALVASAGAYIAVKCKTFSLAKNGQFMIHKPSGFVGGNEQEVENYLTLLRNMTKTYYDAFIAKLKKKESDFKAKWNAGDFWMTSDEAVEWGFITSVKEPVRIDEPTAKLIRACGCPNDVTTNTEKTDMELKAMAISVGLPADATEQQVNAKIAEFKSKADQYDALKASTEKKEKDERVGKVKAALDKAISEKRIKADSRKDWEELFEKGYETTLALLEKQEPIEKLSSQIIVNNDGKGATFNGKTFEQWQESDPDALAQLEKDNPDAFNALFADWKKRNKIA